eukprot:TRINITY_DN47129_c0_g1_i1.p1 TRINITY_DN47129_c0_g1~~TRINITY_DN47129_c0_g1_i1.p1  ORF type:complete len:155 (+),score=25.55 TRINITY_DN47129_c0_g1_i1:71-466(+)
MGDLYDRFKREQRLGECAEGCFGGALCGLCLATTSCTLNRVVQSDAICLDTTAICCCIRCAPSATDTLEFQMWLQRNPDLVVRAGLIAAEEEHTQIVVADILTKLSPPPTQEPFTQNYEAPPDVKKPPKNV